MAQKGQQTYGNVLAALMQWLGQQQPVANAPAVAQLGANQIGSVGNTVAQIPGIVGNTLNTPVGQMPGMPQASAQAPQPMHSPVPNPIAGVQSLQSNHLGQPVQGPPSAPVASMQQTPQQGMATNKSVAKGQGYSNYVVKPGDTLWGIAQQHLGNGDLWHQLKIQGNNYHNDPRFLQPGTQVHVPVASMQKSQQG